MAALVLAILGIAAPASALTVEGPDKFQSIAETSRLPLPDTAVQVHEDDCPSEAGRACVYDGQIYIPQEAEAQAFLFFHELGHVVEDVLRPRDLATITRLLGRTGGWEDATQGISIQETYADAYAFCAGGFVTDYPWAYAPQDPIRVAALCRWLGGQYMGPCRLGCWVRLKPGQRWRIAGRAYIRGERRALCGIKTRRVRVRCPWVINRGERRLAVWWQRLSSSEWGEAHERSLTGATSPTLRLSGRTPIAADDAPVSAAPGALPIPAPGVSLLADPKVVDARAGDLKLEVGLAVRTPDATGCHPATTDRRGPDAGHRHRDELIALRAVAKVLHLHRRVDALKVSESRGGA